MEEKPRETQPDEPDLLPEEEPDTISEEAFSETEIQEQIADEVQQELSSGNGHQDLRSNFRIALDELFGKRKDDQTAPAAAEQTFEEVTMADFGTLSGFGKDLNSPALKGFSSAAQPGGAQTSVISAGTVIEGRVISDGHLQVAGTVKGDIAAKGNVRITGSVEGNISGGLIDLNSCTVNGNIAAESTVTLDSGSKLTGDIVSEALVLDGAVNGNLTISGSAELKVHAALHGNVTASALSVEQGAMICGAVKIERKQID